jgi:hypothetical protein
MGGGANMAKIKKDKAEKKQLRKDANDAITERDQIATALRICEQERDELKYQLSNQILNDTLVRGLADKERQIRKLTLKIGEFTAKLDRQEEIKEENQRFREIFEKEFGFEDIVGVMDDGHILAVGDGAAPSASKANEWQQKDMFYGDALIQKGIEIIELQMLGASLAMMGCRICQTEKGTRCGLPLVVGKVCDCCFEGVVMPVSYIMTKYQPAFSISTPKDTSRLYTYMLNEDYFSGHKEDYPDWQKKCGEFRKMASISKEKLTAGLFYTAKNKLPKQKNVI